MKRSTLLRILASVLVLLDIVMLMTATVLAQAFRDSLSWFADGDVLGSTLDLVRVPIILAFLLIIFLMGGYDLEDFETGPEIYLRVHNASIATLALVIMGLFFGQIPMSRGYLLILMIVTPVLLILIRALMRRVVHGLYRRGIGTRRAIIVGHGPVLSQLITRLRERSYLGLTPIAVVHTTHAEAQKLGLPLLETWDGLLPLAEQQNADLILFADGSQPDTRELREYLWQFEQHHTDLAVVSNLIDISADRVRTRPLADTQLVYVEQPRSAQALSAGKRIFDIILATFVLIVLSPVMLITALLVNRDGGPVLFKQTRVGVNGSHFTMLKFRSMVVNAEEILKTMDRGEQVNSKMFKQADDPRITKVGHFIRRYSIDELPQLINVLRGDMSLIGPRPPLPREVAEYTEDEFRRLRVRPGLTGLWQVSGRSDLSWEETIRLDLYYIDNWSFLRDMWILVRTVKAVIAGRGAY